MSLPTTGPLSISDIKTELNSSSNSLKNLSIEAGFSAPYKISNFYGYTAGLSAALTGYGGGGFFRSIRFGNSSSKIILGGDRCGGYYSTDGGSSWKDSTGLYHGRGEHLAVDPNNGNNAIKATTCGVFKTTDAGATWSYIFDNIFTPSRGVQNKLGYLSAVGYNNVNSNYIYAGTGGYHPQADKIDPCNFYKSSDGGVTWTTISPGSSGLPTGSWSIYAIDTSHQNANKIWMAHKNGLYRSADGGSTWSNVGNSAIYVAVDPQNDSNVIMCQFDDYYGYSNLNLYRSTNANDTTPTWVQITNGLDANYSYIIEVKFDPQDTGIVYAANRHVNLSSGNQLYRSDDNGLTWTAIGFTTIPSGEANTHTAAETFDVYAGTVVLAGSDSVYKCINADTMTGANNSNWSSLDGNEIIISGETYYQGKGDEFLDLFLIDVNPVDNAVIFGAVADWKLIKSKDGGVSWKRLTPSGNYYTNGGVKLTSAGDVAFCKANENIAFLSLYDQGGGASSDIGAMLRSTNALATSPTWTLLDATSGLPYAPSGHDSRRLWEVVSNSRGDMFTQAYGAIYRSVFDINNPNDVGLSWTWEAGVYGNKGHFAIAPSDESIMYFAMETVNDAGIWKSTNYGNSWTLQSFTTTDIIHTSGIAVDPTNSNIVWIAQPSYTGYNQGKGGVWKVDMTAQTTSLIFAATTDPDGITIPYFYAYGLIIDPNDSNTIIVATKDQFNISSNSYNNIWKGQGIWYTTDGGTTWKSINNVGHNVALGVSLDEYNKNVYVGIDQRGAYKISLI